MFNNNATFNIVTTSTDDVIEGNASGTAETFRNFGDLNKPNSGTIRILPGTFNNSGNVDIDMGTLKIESPNTTHSGTYDVAGNATLQTTATNHDIDTASPFEAASAGRFFVSSGTVNFNSASTILPAGLELDFDAGTLGGTGNVEVNGTFNWGSAGSLSVAGGVVTKATTNLIGSGDKDLKTTWDNDGTVNFNDGDFDLADASAVFNNNATFNIVTTNSDDVIEGNASGTAETFSNFGNLNKPNSGTITVSLGTFNNSGNVDVGDGNLSFVTGGGGTSPGDFSVLGGATLEFNGGTHDLADADVSGMGTVDFDDGTVTLSDTGAAGGSYSVEATTFTGGTANFNYDADTNSLTLTTGTLAGSGNFTVNDQFTWKGGFMSGTGPTVVPVGATMSFTTTADKEFRRTLQHDSTTGMSAWTDGRVDFLDGTFNNTGNFAILAANTLQTQGGINVLNNMGTLTGNSDGLAVINIPFNNTGTLAVQGGNLSLDEGGTSPGDITVSGGAILEFDGGTHDLADADVSGMGTVDFDSFTVTLSDTGAAGGSYSVEATTFTGGTANFNYDADTNSLTLTTGTFAGSGNFTVNDQFTWKGGFMSGTGTTVVPVGATMSFTTTADKEFRRTLQHDSTTGMSAWTDGRVDFLNGTFNNTGNFAILAANTLQTQGGINVLNNMGTLTGNSDGLAVINIPFNNTGTLAVQGGNLSLDEGGTSPGDITVSVGAILEFDGGNHDLTDADVSGMGTADFDSGTVTLSDTGAAGGSYSVDSTTFTGGTSNFNYDAGTNSLTLTTGNLTGSGNFTVNDQFTWKGDIMSGSGTTVVPVGATMSFTTTADKEFRRTLQHDSNTGMSAWTDGRVDFLDGTFNNTGNFAILAENTLQTQGGINVLNNMGTLTGNSDGLAVINIPFNNTGTLAVQGGNLSLDEGGTSPGDITVSGGAILEFDGGTHDLADADVSGMGTVDFDSGTVTLSDTGAAGGNYSVEATTFTGGTANFNYDADTNSLTLTTGTLAGSGNFTVNDQFTWKGDIMSGSGTTVVPVGATMSFTTTADKEFRRTLQHDSNTGMSAWTDGRVDFLDGTFNNTGNFDIQAINTLDTQGGINAFNNSGTLRGNSAGLATIDVPFNNTGALNVQSGTLSFTRNFTQTAGETLLTGGILNSNGTININGGVLGGAGNIDANISNAGSVSPGTSTGILRIDGNYTQTSDGLLDLEIGGLVAGTDFDQLDVTGTATLAGTLSVALTGGYSPILGHSFQIIPAAGVVGDFETEMFPGASGRKFYNLVLGPPVTLTFDVIDSYPDWKKAVFSKSDQADSNVSDSDKDPDNDGRTNLLEYVFGTEAQVPDASLDFTVEIITDTNEDFLTVTFPWATDIVDFFYIIETSTDLITWPVANEVFHDEVIGDGIDILTRKLTDTIDGEPKRFVRLLVTED